MLIPPPSLSSDGTQTGMHAVLVVIGALVFRVTLGCLGMLAFGLRIFTHSPSPTEVKASDTEPDAIPTLERTVAHLDV